MTLQVELLEQSFEPIRMQSAQFGAAFYDRLFTDYPDAKPLFAHTDMQTQQQHLMQALTFTIDHLRNSQQLADALKDLGARHVSYGTLQAHYPLVGATLLKTLETFLGTAWTPQLEQAWTDAYEAIAQIMLQGAETVPPR